MRYKFPREFYIPKGSAKIADKLSDAVAYVYTTGNGKPCAAVFFGKQAKPIAHVIYRTEERREDAIKTLFQGRRDSVAFKTQQRAKRAAWVPDYKVGEILHTNWGYDQTNVEYFEVTEVRGKHVVLREIQQESVETGFMSGKCVPLAGKFAEPRYAGDDRGVPIRRLAQEHGIKIDDVRTAFRGRSTKIAGVTVHDSLHWSSYA